MTFTVTYREKSGAKAEAEIEATSRAECFARCKARGIVPLGVKEGRSDRSNISPKSTKGGHRRQDAQSSPRRASFLGALGGLTILALLIGGVSWWLGRDEAQSLPPPAEKPKAVMGVRDVKTPKERSSAPSAVTAVSEKPPETNFLDKVRADLAKVRERMKTADEYSYYNLERKARDLEKLLTDEKMQFHTTNREGIVDLPFKTCTEQVLDWVFNCEVGGDPPPLVPPLDPGEMANIGEILDRANEVLEGDSDEVAARKEMVERAKRELKDYLAQGGNAADFLQFYYNELKNAYELRLEASKLVRQFAHNEDPETARKYLEATNKELAKKGIAPVMLSDKTKMRLGLPVEEEKGAKK